MSKHTEGPWRLHDMEAATVVAGKPGQEVANCRNGFGDQDANARLIAAAPELLAAARKTVAALEDESPIRGKSDEFIYDELGSAVSAAYFAARDAIAKATGADHE